MVIKLEQMNAHAYYPRCAFDFGISAAIVAGTSALMAAGGAAANSASARRAEQSTRESIEADRQALIAERNSALDKFKARESKRIEEIVAAMQRRTGDVAGKGAVNGASNAELTSEKEAIADMGAQMTAQANADAEANAQQVEDKANANIRTLDSEMRNAQAQASQAKQQAVINGAQQVANAAGSFIASNYDHGGTTTPNTNGGGTVVPKNIDTTAKIQNSAVKNIGTPKFSTSNAEIQGRLKDIYARGGFKINPLK